MPNFFALLLLGKRPVLAYVFRIQFLSSSHDVFFSFSRYWELNPEPLYSTGQPFLNVTFILIRYYLVTEVTRLGINTSPSFPEHWASGWLLAHILFYCSLLLGGTGIATAKAPQSLGFLQAQVPAFLWEARGWITVWTDTWHCVGTTALHPRSMSAESLSWEIAWTSLF